MLVVESKTHLRSTSSEIQKALEKLDMNCKDPEDPDYAVRPVAPDARQVILRSHNRSQAVEADFPEKIAERLQIRSLREYPGPPVKRETM